MTDLAQVLTDWSGQGAVLRARGHGREADHIEQLVGEVKAAAAPYLDWLSEDEAMLRSGRSRGYLRTRYPEWASEDMARLDGRRRKYRRCIVPRRANIDTARADAREAARGAA